MTDDKPNEEHISVSNQSDHILEYMEERFHFLITQDEIDDAISIGDEYIEWMKAEPDEIYQYYLTYELEKEYLSRQQS